VQGTAQRKTEKQRLFLMKVTKPSLDTLQVAAQSNSQSLWTPTSALTGTMGHGGFQ
jgi:hypothetical protein